VAALAPTTAADTSSSTSSLEHALEPPDAQVDRSETVGADSDFAGVETTSPASQASQELASDTAAPEGAVAPRPAATESAANLPETTTGLNEIQSDHLLRAQLSWGIYRREPTDTVGESVEISGPGSRKIYYFTAIQGMRGETVRHRWVYQGRTMANVRFLIGGDRWRVYSSKNLSPQMTGTWQVWVEDANGKSLGRREFRVEPASASE
jgi:hypothetical protein